jgi:hypothetical protein
MAEQDINWGSKTHFIFIGFAAANGEPVMCTVILTAQTPLKAMEI